MISLLMLAGHYKFTHHWLFYQEAIDLCNANNPAGGISASTIYVSVVFCAMIFGAAVTLKRHWLGMKLGKIAYRK